MAFIAAGSTLSAVTTATGTWTLGVTDGGISIENARYIRVGNIVSATVWAKGTSAPTYDSTPFAFTGLPITPLNTGDAADCVGWGTYAGKGSNAGTVLWVLSNNTNIYIGRAGDWYTANNSTVGSLVNHMGGTNGFRYSRGNMTSQFGNSADTYFAFQVNYYV